ncbi:hypothetical protein TWF569_000669 [Orbilia oligospora]|uniref:DUF676 domain-containing protein n=1 Tax=Orbilia oligospora TaxID=2813651 RepID=A0A7C8N0D0_ORBOL|nr:hypothetical protein TWF102_000982 [Orbilia oligospora]KAF3103779.1 hypothetical protein TWF706_004820 [Orbilia oligospora]KAF3124566.1 hypothetical protein TWF594_001829 [Orbilia oligospora]KAF3125930.1 hypothetical protein TWF569_000669 [Orbilia oligospora]
MMFGDNLGIFRAVDIDKNTTADEFKTVLMGYLSQEEHGRFTIDKLHLAPYPIDDCGTQVAVFKFAPAIPSFLKKVATGEKKHLRGQNGNRIEVDANFRGLTQLNHPKEDILLDIVAISGLANHAYGAWSGVESSGTVQMWLQDFLPEEPDLGSRCRIMIYGYSTEADDLVTYVAGFLEELSKARRKLHQQSRPLVLVGHSHGGIIIAEAFVKASWDKRYKSIHLSTVQIFSFGVPYKGINPDQIDIVKTFRGADHFGRIFQETRYTTQNLEFFRHLIERTNTQLSSFYETQDTKKRRKLNITRENYPTESYERVVYKNSAVLGLSDDLEEDYDVDGDHISLVQFTSRTGRTYTTIIGLLQRLLGTGLRNKVLARTTSGLEAAHQQDIVEKRDGSESSLTQECQSSEEAEYVYNQLLRIAAAFNLPVLVRQLLDHGADPKFHAHDPRYKKWATRRWIFDFKSTPNGKESSKRAGDQKLVENILRSNKTALELALENQNDKVFQLLVQVRSDYAEDKNLYKELI